MATSTLGDVLDVSAGGMRVKSSIKLEKGQSVIVTIGTPAGPMPVQCTVMWVQRHKLFWHTIGLRFENLNAAALRFVNEFARAASNQELVRPSVQKMVDDARKAS